MGANSFAVLIPGPDPIKANFGGNLLALAF